MSPTEGISPTPGALDSAADIQFDEIPPPHVTLAYPGATEGVSTAHPERGVGQRSVERAPISDGFG